MGRRSGKFYEGEVSEAERARKAKLSEPHRVSCELLEPFIYKEGHSVLDVGCGSDPRLAQWVNARHGRYFGLDIREDETAKMYDELKKLNIEPEAFFPEDVMEMSRATLNLDPVDVVHERFMLAHLSYHQRPAALKNMMQFAEQRVILIHYDWTDMMSTFYSEILNNFKKTAFEGFREMEFDPFFGRSLQAFVGGVFRNARRFEHKRETRLERDYTHELIDMCGSLEDHFKKTERTDLARRFAEHAEFFAKQPIEFVPAAINTVTIPMYS